MSETQPSLREIRMFVAVFEERSFTAAALREHATQSGVSQHIRHIEDRLGTLLFIRNKGITPTPAGTVYYARCQQVLRAHAEARRTLDEFSRGLAGEATVGLLPSMTSCVLAPAYLRFKKDHPNATVRIVEAYSAVLTDRVAASELDFAIVPAPHAPIPGLQTTLFTRTPEFLVASLHSGLQHGEPVHLPDLPQLKLVVPGVNNARRTSIDDYLSTQLISAKRIELDAMLGTLDLVRRSDWKAILPGLLLAQELAAEPAQREFTIHPLHQPALALDLVLHTPAKQPLSPVADAFLAILRDVSREMNRLPLALAQDVPRTEHSM